MYQTISKPHAIEIEWLILINVPGDILRQESAQV